MPKHLLLSFLILLALPVSTLAESSAPWGTAKTLDIEYTPHKVVYDIAVSNVSALESALDRASYLSKLYGADPFSASIVLVLHGDEINYFATKNYLKHKALMERARSLSVGGIIKFHMCKIAAKAHGYDPDDIHGFVDMVPMADAEIIRLQREEGYAYMQ